MSELLKRASKAIAEDNDHMSAASGQDLEWLIAQLACWPERVDPDCTTNLRFLMMSAAASLMAFSGLSTPPQEPHHD